MTIGTLITEGFGSFGDVAHVVRDGFDGKTQTVIATILTEAFGTLTSRSAYLVTEGFGSTSTPPIPPAVPVPGGHGEGDAYRVYIYGKPYTVRTQAAYYALLRHLTEAKENQAVKEARKRSAPVPVFEARADVAIPDSWVDIAAKNVQTIVEARTSLRLMEFIERPPVVDPDIWDELPLEVILIALS